MSQAAAEKEFPRAEKPLAQGDTLLTDDCGILYEHAIHSENVRRCPPPVAGTGVAFIV
jgi:hypothetical protein